MVSEKVIVVLIVVAILLSIVSVVVTLSASVSKPVYSAPKVVYNYAPPKQPDLASARIGLIVSPPKP
jgi:hypothetical protein